LAPESDPLNSAAAQAVALARRDYFLLPLLSLLTMVLLFAGTEIVTRMLWTAEEHGYCLAFDPIVGPHGKPDCVFTVKVSEAPAPVVHRFNHCGYRSEASCGPKAPGVFRIALLGSSIAEGYIIPYNQMLGSQLTNTLRQVWPRRVELENLGAEACPPIYSYRHVGEALHLQPDAVVLILNPWDLEQDVDPKLMALRDDPKPIDHAPAPTINLNPVQQLQAWAHESRTMLVAQHYMLQDEATFIKLYLMAGGDHTAFVRYPFSPSWSRRFGVTDILLGEMARKIHAAGARFLVVAVPERAQVLMLRDPNLPPGIDPYAFTRELSHMAGKHGILFVDGLKAFAGCRDPESLFYVVDGHPTPLAHKILGEAAARELIEAPASPGHN
jgi:hypothetical protein